MNNRFEVFKAMMIEVLKSKLHRVVVVDNNNGERFETYIIKGERGSGCICLNGAAARKVMVGDTIIIISYALMDFDEAKTFTPTVVFPKEGNKL